ncbi:hypothetical protein ACFSR7_05850 [Cohnella sp. GCM10020058]|uniref:hypothetical protein n=1 Tax=Cohnella sp. GCM10020058 TaxID=3317330 RepID=UPI00363DF571
MPIATAPDDAAGCRRLQLQQILERRAGRVVVSAWLTIAADPDATTGPRAGACSCSCSSAAPGVTSLAPG